MLNKEEKKKSFVNKMRILTDEYHIAYFKVQSTIETEFYKRKLLLII